MSFSHLLSLIIFKNLSISVQTDLFFDCKPDLEKKYQESTYSSYTFIRYFFPILFFHGSLRTASF